MTYRKEKLVNKIYQRYKDIGIVRKKDFYSKYNISFKTMKKYFSNLDNVSKECNIIFHLLKYNTGQKIKGKTYEQIYGKTIALERKKSLRNYRIGSRYEDFMTKEDSLRVKKQRSIERKGKTFVEIFGEKQAKQIIKNMNRKGWWIIGRNEKKILDEIENYIGLKINRGYSVIFRNGKRRHLDGYIIEKKINIEIDEKYHNKLEYKQQDNIYDKYLKEILNCNIIRINEQKWINNKDYKTNVLEIIDRFIRIEVIN